MAIAAATVWEVRAAGSATNGGGFVAGSTGTDWTQQNAAQYSVTDGVTAGTTTITSATAAFGTDVVGNLMYVQGGTGAVVAGWYQIVSRTNATTVVVDRTTGLTAGTGVTLKIGGALDSLATLAGPMIASNVAFLKGSFTQTATTTFTVAVTPAPTVPATRIEGYATARGDGTQATITLSTNTGLTAIKSTGGGFSVRGFIVDCGNLGTSSGITLATFSQVNNCLVKNYVTAGISVGQNSLVHENEVGPAASAASTAYGILSSGQQSTIFGNYVHDMTCGGVQGIQGCQMIENVVDNCTGATSDGIQANGSQNTIYRNTVYGCGRDGIRINQAASTAGIIKGNVLANNGGYGFNLSAAAGTAAMRAWDGNAYGFPANTLGNRNNVDDTTTNKQNATGAYTNALDITLTATTFTNVGTNDFTLNTTAGGGASARSAGYPRTWPGLAVTGYPDMGAIDHQDPAGASFRYISMDGDV